MKDLFALFLPLVTTVAKLLEPGGIKTVLAETLLVKNQLLVINRPRRRTTNLTVWDRVLIGLCSLFMNHNRTRKTSVILRSTTFLNFHDALKKPKYRLLFSSNR